MTRYPMFDQIYPRIKAGSSANDILESLIGSEIQVNCTVGLTNRVKFTNKHFRAVAEQLSAIKDNEVQQLAVEHFSWFFSRSVQKFDRSRFKASVDGFPVTEQDGYRTDQHSVPYTVADLERASRLRSSDVGGSDDLVRSLVVRTIKQIYNITALDDR